jgi:hypothetical protein
VAFTYDPTTDRGKVRLLIGDTDEATADNQLFQDNEIDTFLSMEGSTVRLAAALALETMASSEAFITKRIRLLDLTTDGPAVAAELRKRAESLRSQEDEDGEFDYAEWVLDAGTLDERIHNEALREG